MTEACRSSTRVHFIELQIRKVSHDIPRTYCCYHFVSASDARVNGRSLMATRGYLYRSMGVFIQTLNFNQVLEQMVNYK